MLFSTDIGIDLGTATILVHIRGKGIILNEPSVVALDQDNKKVLAVGEEAQKMLGRTPGNIVAVRPLREGVIADFDTTELMLKHFVSKVGAKKRMFRPRVVVCIPAGTTSVEQKAVIEALTRIGAREAFLVEEPRAAAMGAGLDIFKPSGSMVVDIGGGTSDIAVLSLGDVVEGTSVRVGGDKLDEAISRYIKKEYNVLVGERASEELKRKIGSAYPEEDDLSMEIRGRDLVTGLPRSLSISTSQVAEAIDEPLSEILQGIKYVLERTPPELSGDIIKKGAVLTGGGAMLRGLSQYFAQDTGIAYYLADDPIGSVVIGTSKVLENLDQMAPTLITNKKIAATF